MNFGPDDEPQTPEEQRQFEALVEVIRLLRAGKPLPFEVDDEERIER